MRTISRLAPLVLVGVLLTGCVPEPAQTAGPDPDGGPSGTPSATGEASGYEVEEVRELGLSTWRVSLNAIERSGDVAVVSGMISLEGGDDRIDLGSYLDRNLAPGSATAVAGGRLVEPESRLVHETLRRPAQGDAQPIVGREAELATYVGEGDDFEFSFATSAPDSDTADVLLPYFGMFPDVAVEDVDEFSDLTVPDDAIVTPPYELGQVTVAYDRNAETEQTGETKTARLTSDVLFATDSAELSGDAVARIADVAKQIDASGASSVLVVGHTDDVDTDAYNQDLSERRAAAVGAQLGRALGGVDIKTEGRGEKEPIAEGTSEEARRANRRVEITYEQKVEPPAPKETADVELPDAEVPVGRGGEGVEISGVAGDYTISATSVERRDGLLVATLTAEAGERVGGIPGVFGAPEAAPRWITDSVHWQSGTYQTMLLTADGWSFPLEYEREAPTGVARTSILGDDYMPLNVRKPGARTTATVVWPDPGTDTVTIEGAGRWRLEDVPVTEAEQAED